MLKYDDQDPRGIATVADIATRMIQKGHTQKFLDSRRVRGRRGGLYSGAKRRVQADLRREAVFELFDCGLTVADVLDRHGDQYGKRSTLYRDRAAWKRSAPEADNVLAFDPKRFAS